MANWHLFRLGSAWLAPCRDPATSACCCPRLKALAGCCTQLCAPASPGQPDNYLHRSIAGLPTWCSKWSRPPAEEGRPAPAMSPNVKWSLRPSRAAAQGPATSIVRPAEQAPWMHSAQMAAAAHPPSQVEERALVRPRPQAAAAARPHILLAAGGGQPRQIAAARGGQSRPHTSLLGGGGAVGGAQQRHPQGLETSLGMLGAPPDDSRSPGWGGPARHACTQRQGFSLGLGRGVSAALGWA